MSILGTCEDILLGKGIGAADGIKVVNYLSLKSRVYPGFSGWAQCDHKGPLNVEELWSQRLEELALKMKEESQGPRNAGSVLKHKRQESRFPPKTTRRNIVLLCLGFSLVKPVLGFRAL